jgi:hypothetical protein
MEQVIGEVDAVPRHDVVEADERKEMAAGFVRMDDT